MKSTDWLPFNDAVSDPRATIHYTDNPEVMAAILDVKLRHVQKCALIVLADCVIEIVA